MVLIIKSKKKTIPRAIYYLYSKRIKLRNNTRSRTIYYFAQELTSKALRRIPNGFEIYHMKRTGMPLLRKIKTIKNIIELCEK